MAGRLRKERREERCTCRRRSNFGLSCWQNTRLIWTRIWALRQQIGVLRRTAPKRLSFSAFDRLVFVGLYQLFPEICDALAIMGRQQGGWANIPPKRKRKDRSALARICTVRVT